VSNATLIDLMSWHAQRRDQEVVFGAGDHVDDRITDAENVVAGCGHFRVLSVSGAL
jgi:hypothetical protein